MNKDRILELLKNEEYVSGEWMSEKLGVTRAAIWKAVDVLRKEGHDIRSVKKRGYHLEPPRDALWPACIRKGLNTQWCGVEIEYHDQLDSTNTRCKDLAREGGAHGMLVISEEQTMGRGRLNRGWISQPGRGIWMTLLVRPRGMMPERAPALVLLAAVATAMACERVSGVEVMIKWPNDLVAQGKKICGMLLEMGAGMDGVEWAVIGIGINIKGSDFPEELRDKAGDLAGIAGREIERAALVREFLCQFERLYNQYCLGGMSTIYTLYRNRSITLGRQVRALCPDGEYLGVAQDIDEDGTLILETQDGERIRLRVGDVSVRGVMGYV